MDLALPRIIFHVDMDAFYAAVEVRDHPELAGQPLIIGHKGPRGVVSTCSYEARRFGVHSAMPSVTAHRLCPQAIWRPGRMARYLRVSRSLRRLFEATTPVVEPLSIDEAFLDMTGIASGLEDARHRAWTLKQAIQEDQGLTASIGVARNKFLAKVASDMEKPDGLVVLDHDAVARRLWPLPLRRLWGVGPRMEERLLQLGLTTVGDLAGLPLPRLEAAVGASSARHLARLARGEDDRPVDPHHARKSISEERTYGRDLRSADAADRALLARCEGVSRQLRQQGLCARRVHLKVRAGDFTTWTRSHTLADPTQWTEPIVHAARMLLRQRVPLAGRGIRLLGVGVSGLEPLTDHQEELFPDHETRQSRRLARGTDAVRARYGDDMVTRARLARPSARAGKGRNQRDDDEASSLPAVD